MRIRVITAFLALIASTAAAAAQPLSAAQHDALKALAADDLSVYLEGGKAAFADDWSKVALPWAEDKDIGMRYARGAIAADEFFGDRTLFIRGRYLSADNWIGESYRVQLWLLAAIVDKDKAAFLGDAKNGNTVALACHAQGQELQTAYVRDCQSADEAIASLADEEVALLLKRAAPNDLKAIEAARR